jgi:hypothetical protein
MPDAFFGALVFVAIVTICLLMWAFFPIARRDEAAEVPLPGSLGQSRWVELDEWESEHVDSMLALFADRQQYHLDLWAREMQEAR